MNLKKVNFAKAHEMVEDITHEDLKKYLYQGYTEPNTDQKDITFIFTGLNIGPFNQFNAYSLSLSLISQKFKNSEFVMVNNTFSRIAELVRATFLSYGIDVGTKLCINGVKFKVLGFSKESFYKYENIESVFNIVTKDMLHKSVEILKDTYAGKIPVVSSVISKDVVTIIFNQYPYSSRFNVISNNMVLKELMSEELNVYAAEYDQIISNSKRLNVLTHEVELLGMKHLKDSTSDAEKHMFNSSIATGVLSIIDPILETKVH